MFFRKRKRRNEPRGKRVIGWVVRVVGSLTAIAGTILVGKAISKTPTIRQPQPGPQVVETTKTQSPFDNSSQKIGHVKPDLIHTSSDNEYNWLAKAWQDAQELFGPALLTLGGTVTVAFSEAFAQELAKRFFSDMGKEVVNTVDSNGNNVTLFNIENLFITLVDAQADRPETLEGFNYDQLIALQQHFPELQAKLPAIRKAIQERNPHEAQRLLTSALL